MRVTTGGSASEIRASAANSANSKLISSFGSMPIAHSCSERMSAPVFVDEVLGWALAERTKPLRTVRGHPDEVTGFNRIPRVAKPVDAATFKHQQAMLHHVNLHHAE